VTLSVTVLDAAIMGNISANGAIQIQKPKEEKDGI